MLFLAFLGLGCVSAQAKSSQVEQSILFATIPGQVYGNGSIQLNASASSGLPVQFSLKKGSAIVSGDRLFITGAGAITVRASQKGNSVVKAAKDVERTFNVDKVQVVAKADPVSVTKGGALPAFNISYSGFVNGESSAVLDQKPKASVKVKNTSVAGTYPITLAAGKDNNYNIVLQNGSLTVVSPTPFYYGGTVTVGLTGSTGSSSSVTTNTLGGSLSMASPPVVPAVTLTIQMLAGLEPLPTGVTMAGSYSIQSFNGDAISFVGDVQIKASVRLKFDFGIDVDGDLSIEAVAINLEDAYMHVSGYLTLNVTERVNVTNTSSLTQSGSGNIVLTGNTTYITTQTITTNGSLVLLNQSQVTLTGPSNYNSGSIILYSPAAPTGGSSGSSSYTTVTSGP